MAARGGRNAVLRLSAALRVKLQRILPAARDGPLAADPARRLDRISESHRFARVDAVVGRWVWRFKRIAGDFLRSSARQRDSWRAARFSRRFFSAAMDGLRSGSASRSPGLVYDSDRRSGILLSSHTWRAMAD